MVSNGQEGVDDEEMEEVILVWNQGKQHKAIRDLAMDNTPEDKEVLSYYRFNTVLRETAVVDCVCIHCIYYQVF